MLPQRVANYSSALRCLSSWAQGGRPSSSRRPNRDHRDHRDRRAGSRDGREYRNQRDRGREPGPTATRSGESIPQIKGEALYGIHSVLQVLSSQHRRIHGLYLRDPLTVMTKKSPSDALLMSQIKALAADHDIPMETTRFFKLLVVI